MFSDLEKQRLWFLLRVPDVGEMKNYKNGWFETDEFLTLSNGEITEDILEKFARGKIIAYNEDKIKFRITDINDFS